MAKKTKPVSDTSQIMLEAMITAQHASELMEMSRQFFALMGGPAGFAKELHREFMNSKSGGLVRFKILDLVMQIQRFITPKDASKEELGLLSEDDLQRVYREAMKHVEKEKTKNANPASDTERTDRADTNGNVGAGANADVEQPAESTDS